MMKISRAFVQRYLISYSCNWTGFPGRLPRTVKYGQHFSNCAGKRARKRKKMFKVIVVHRVAHVERPVADIVTTRAPACSEPASMLFPPRVVVSKNTNSPSSNLSMTPSKSISVVESFIILARLFYSLTLSTNWLMALLGRSSSGVAG